MVTVRKNSVMVNVRNTFVHVIRWYFFYVNSVLTFERYILGIEHILVTDIPFCPSVRILKMLGEALLCTRHYEMTSLNLVPSFTSFRSSKI